MFAVAKLSNPKDLEPSNASHSGYRKSSISKNAKLQKSLIFDVEKQSFSNFSFANFVLQTCKIFNFAARKISDFSTACKK